MFVILVYDVGEKRVAKMLKTCRKYLHWIQNSVFEGELTALQLKQLEHDCAMIMDKSYDSLIIFTTSHGIAPKKRVIGVDKNRVDNFI